MKIDELYKQETGENPWIEYAHIAGPTKEFWVWIESRFAALKAESPANGSVPANLVTTNSRSDEIAFLESLQKVPCRIAGDLGVLGKFEEMINDRIAQLRAVR